MEVSMSPHETTGPPSPIILRISTPLKHYHTAPPSPPSGFPMGKRSRGDVSDDESDVPARMQRLDDDDDDNHGEGPSRLQGMRITLRLPLLGGGKPPKSLPKGRSQRSQTLPLDETPRRERNRPSSNLSRGKPRTRARARRSSIQSETSLEAISAESIAVKREINRLGLGLRDVTGDGNCLFRALADQLWGEGGRHGEVRRVVCDYLEAHRKGKGDTGDGMEGFVVPFLQDGEDYEGYVKRMRQPKQFGSHIEIQAASRVFKRNIRVVMSSTSFTIVWQDESNPPEETHPQRSMTPLDPPDPSEMDPDLPPDAQERPRPRTRASTHTLPLVPIYPPGQSMLWLALFSQAEHFQSVRRVSKLTGKIEGAGPAEVEDHRMIPHERDSSEAAKRDRGEFIPEAVKTTTSSETVKRLMASLPPGHDISEQKAAGVLGRVKGDLGEALEILLEELDLERQSDTSSGGSDQHVETLLGKPLSQSTYRDRVSSLESTSPSETIVSDPSTSSVSLPESTSTQRSGINTPLTSTSESEKPKPTFIRQRVKSAPNTPRKDLPRELRAIENFLGAGKKESPIYDSPDGSRMTRRRMASAL